MDIPSSLESINSRIVSACNSAKREPRSVRLLAVTKRVEVKRITEALIAGARLFGENYVQDAAKKIPELRKWSIANFAKTNQPEFHFIGHLQRNKVKEAVSLFDVIQTVGSERLLGAIISECKKREVRQKIYLQVNVSEQESKSGANTAEVLSLARLADSNREFVCLEGLMSIGSLGAGAKKEFKLMGQLFEEILASLSPEGAKDFSELSMGMSGDFEEAILHGSSLVRVGSAIFGERVI